MTCFVIRELALLCVMLSMTGIRRRGKPELVPGFCVHCHTATAINANHSIVRVSVEDELGLNPQTCWTCGTCHASRACYIPM